jgi:hypothetical protein
LVRDRHLKTGFDQRLDLMSPQIPALRKAVEENDERPLALNNRA